MKPCRVLYLPVHGAHCDSPIGDKLRTWIPGMSSRDDMPSSMRKLSVHSHHAFLGFKLPFRSGRVPHGLKRVLLFGLFL